MINPTPEDFKYWKLATGKLALACTAHPKNPPAGVVMTPYCGACDYHPLDQPGSVYVTIHECDEKTQAPLLEIANLKEVAQAARNVFVQQTTEARDLALQHLKWALGLENLG